MKRGSRQARIELAIAAHSLFRWQCLDLHTSLPELLERLGVRMHLPVSTCAHEQPLRKFVDHLLEIGENEPVPIGAPPVTDDTFWQDDHVPGLLLAIDDDAAEAVSIDPRRSPHLRLPIFAAPREVETPRETLVQPCVSRAARPRSAHPAEGRGT